MREEDISTSTGVNTPAAMTLWKLVKDDVKLRNRVISIISTYKNYYKCLSDIKNVKVRTHMIILLMKSGEAELLDTTDAKVNSYFKNVMKYLYRISMEETNEDWKVENSKKLKSSRQRLTF